MFAEAKQWHGMERVRLRTLEGVNTEVLLAAAGQNVKRLLRFGFRRPGRTAQVAALRPPGGRCPRLLHRHRTAQRGVSQHAAGVDPKATGEYRRRPRPEADRYQSSRRVPFRIFAAVLREGCTRE
ncbi:MAG: hypothetical protein M3Q49_15695 [Actinomycetota bacterium]|nr:hypothetical protein [Actinomycetota bacterium]